MKIVVCDQAGSRRAIRMLRVDAIGHLDRGSRPQLRDQRAGRLRARRSAAAEGEARRRGGGAVRRSGARRADHSRSAGQGRRPRHSHRRGRTSARSIRWRWRGCWPPRCAAEKPDLILTGLQSDDLGYGQTGVILAEAARHCRTPPSSCRWRSTDGAHPREARAGGRLVPARRDAAAGGADHSIAASTSCATPR